ncbi:MAG: phosphatase PAP2 family protein [Acidobacteriota bacterium]
MSPWALVAAAYGGILAGTVLLHPIRRRALVGALAVAYALVALGLGTLPLVAWMELAAPGALLLVGYWLSGPFFRDPQPWLEAWLLASDRRLLEALSLDARLARAPRWILETLELAYAADYLLVAGGAVVVAVTDVRQLTSYWTLVLSAELACYVALAWLRSRPPRVLEGEGAMARRDPRARRINVAILDGASVGANTLPSGHVAGATAVALALLEVNMVAGSLAGVAALAIGVAAVAGRYHYVVDCVAGASVAVIVWAVL